MGIIDDSVNIAWRIDGRVSLLGHTLVEEAFMSENRISMYRKRRALGLCGRCDKPPVKGRSLCEVHLKDSIDSQIKQQAKNPAGFLEKRRARDKALRDRRLETGMCIFCGKRERDGDKIECDVCLRYKADHMLLSKARRRTKGLCEDCGKAAPSAEHSPVCIRCVFKRASARYFGNVSKANEFEALWHSQGGICPYSGIEMTIGVDAHIDHIIPLAKGGLHTIKNMQWANIHINRMKRDHLEDDFLDWVTKIYNHRVRQH